MQSLVVHITREADGLHVRGVALYLPHKLRFKETFNQSYWVNPWWWDKRDGPVFLYLGAEEYSMNMFASNSGEYLVFVFAKLFQFDASVIKNFSYFLRFGMCSGSVRVKFGLVLNCLCLVGQG